MARVEQTEGQGDGRVRIRHYCQGIGDCHLLRLPRASGGEFFMLIDCGVHPSVKGGPETMRRIVADIASLTDRIDVLIVTHEHMDHVSGFISAADEFEGIEVGDVWFAWTENPQDPQAKELDEFKADVVNALGLAASRLAALGPKSGLAGMRSGVDAVLGFHFGAKGERVRAARDAARALGKGQVVYHEPGDGPLSLDGVEGVQVYVLGPPRDIEQLRIDERAGATYGSAFGMAPEMSRALALGAGGAGARDEDAPFAHELGIALQELMPMAESLTAKVDRSAPDADDRRALVELLRHSYAGPARTRDPAQKDQSWRRIDNDVLGLSAELALQLDRMTNNTSLVLAIELVPSGRVLLFPADAQVGSWLSWHDLKWGDGQTVVRAADLLSRTVYVKVAHHGSNNGTLEEMGLELMRDRDLAAFIPVKEEDASKVGWHDMPSAHLLEALAERTSGRVIRADDPWIAGGEVPAELECGAAQVLGRHDEGLWVEVGVA